MPRNYLDNMEPDVDDYFSQIVPQPPDSSTTKEIAFMGPFVNPADRWFAFRRSGDTVEGVEGSYEQVWQWLLSSDTRNQWVYDLAQEQYVRV